MSADEIDLQVVRDELAIRALVARYCDAVARRDEAAWTATWTDDGIWNVGPHHPKGHADLVKTWSGLMDLFRFVIQMPHAAVIEIDGGHATGTWQVTELGWPVQGPASCTLGIYKDRYRRVADGWRFASRDFHFMYMGPPDLSGGLIGHPDAPLPRSES